MDLSARWEAVAILMVFATLALIVAVVFWKLMPTSSSAFLDGRHWKLGGAFGGFVVTLWLLISYYPDIFELIEPHRAREEQEDLAVRASVVHPPTDRKGYTLLFDGFSDSDFFAFNAPFAVEYVGTQLKRGALEIHERRYKSNVSSKYLFFDQISFDRAKGFFALLSQEIGQEKLDRSSRTCLWERAARRPTHSYFVGKKEGKSVVVFYPVAELEAGLPTAVIYIEGADELHKILINHFTRKWGEAGCQ